MWSQKTYQKFDESRDPESRNHFKGVTLARIACLVFNKCLDNWNFKSGYYVLYIKANLHKSYKKINPF